MIIIFFHIQINSFFLKSKQDYVINEKKNNCAYNVCTHEISSKGERNKKKIYKIYKDYVSSQKTPILNQIPVINIKKDERSREKQIKQKVWIDSDEWRKYEK